MKLEFFDYLLRLADDHLILAHRLSEWCGHAPVLEEDLALPNIALDLLGQARALYAHAGAVEGKGRGEDQLAYLRVECEYRNLLLVERENGDFAHTMLRLYFFAAFMEIYWEEMTASRDENLAAIAAKAVKEARYHVRHAAEWVIRLGDGTEESARRLAAAYHALAPYCAEMFEADAVVDKLAGEGIAVDPASLKADWRAAVGAVFAAAMLDCEVPLDGHQSGGRRGVHGEALGHLIAELQYVQRAYPDMEW